DAGSAIRWRAGAPCRHEPVVACFPAMRFRADGDHGKAGRDRRRSRPASRLRCQSSDLAWSRIASQAFSVILLLSPPLWSARSRLLPSLVLSRPLRPSRYPALSASDGSAATASPTAGASSPAAVGAASAVPAAASAA